jgi:hypothetical protein
MTLIWLRTYPTYEVLGVLFDLDKGNISRNLKGVLPALEKVTRYDIEWPDKTRRKLQMTEAMQVFPEVFAIGDGMEQPVQRPKDNEKQKEYYSGKKKRHTVQNQVVAAPSRSLPGCSGKHHLSSQTLPSAVPSISAWAGRTSSYRAYHRWLGEPPDSTSALAPFGIECMLISSICSRWDNHLNRYLCGGIGVLVPMHPITQQSQ